MAHLTLKSGTQMHDRSPRDHWAVEIKRSTTPKVARGFHSACEDLGPCRKWLIYPGTQSDPLLDGIQAMPLHTAMQELAAAPVE